MPKSKSKSKASAATTRKGRVQRVVSLRDVESTIQKLMLEYSIREETESMDGTLKTWTVAVQDVAALTRVLDIIKSKAG